MWPPGSRRKILKSQPGRVLRGREGAATKVWRERGETAEKPDWERVAGSSLIRRESTPQLWMKCSMITYDYIGLTPRSLSYLENVKFAIGHTPAFHVIIENYQLTSRCKNPPDLRSDQGRLLRGFFTSASTSACWTFGTWSSVVQSTAVSMLSWGAGCSSSSGKGD